MVKKYLTLLFLIIAISALGQTDSGQTSFKITANWVKPEEVFDQDKEQKVEEPKIDTASLKADREFLQNLPKSYENLTPTNLKKIANDIENQLQKLIKEKEELLKHNASQDVIESKSSVINTLGKEKKIIDLTLESDDLKNSAAILQIQKEKLRRFLIGALSVLAILVLVVVALLQRKKIKVQDVEIDTQLKDIIKKNSFLDFAARIIRHDMHSGINTYIPRGLSSLEKRISGEQIKQLKIDSSLQLIREGLSHTQRVYKIVYEFTNLVKQNAQLDKKDVDLSEAVSKYLAKTSYSTQVEVSPLPTIQVNELLFCHAIDNLVKNGLKYNDLEDKKVKIYMEDQSLIVEDNGRGFSQLEFEKYLYSKESSEESGLGLKIAYAILSEHGFKIAFEKTNKIGTKVKINILEQNNKNIND